VSYSLCLKYELNSTVHRHICSFFELSVAILRLVKMEKTIRTILDQAQNNNIRHGEHLKALADFYAKVLYRKMSSLFD